MKCLQGVWLPDHEKHLEDFATEPGWLYQVGKFNACHPYIRNRNLAIDVGAHCGLWSMYLCKFFKEVVAFEPVEEHRECYNRNVLGVYTLLPYALGETEKTVGIQTTQGQSGDSCVVEHGELQMRTLDSFDLAPDFIKIDCEGYELFVLKGGVETIKKHRPTIIVEQKPGRAQRYGLGEIDAVRFLQKLGYAMQITISGDYIMSFMAAKP